MPPNGLNCIVEPDLLQVNVIRNGNVANDIDLLVTSGVQNKVPYNILSLRVLTLSSSCAELHHPLLASWASASGVEHRDITETK